MRSIKGKVHGVSDWDINEEARAHVGPEGIVVTLDNGTHVDMPWTGIQLGQNYLYDFMTTVEGTSTTGRKIRFTAESPELGKQIAGLAPGHVSGTLAELTPVVSGARKKHQAYLGFVVFILALAISSFSWLPYVVAAWFPVAWEEAIGHSGLQSVDKNGEVTDPHIVSAVQGVWTRVQSGLQPNPYHFNLHVLTSPEVNAFAMPGGTVVVYTGLLKEVETPEELAGVLGHESQHVIQKHSVKALVRSAEWDFMTALLFSSTNDELRKLGAKMDGLAYSRGNESEADREGLQVLLRAHIDPTRFPEFFRRLQKTSPSHHIALLDTHPTNEQRISTLEALIQNSPPQQYQPINVDWPALHTALSQESP